MAGYEQLSLPGMPESAFQELLNKLRSAGVKVGEAAASDTGRLVAGLGVPTAYGLGSMAQGDITRGIGEIGGGVGLSNLSGEQRQLLELMRTASVKIPVEQTAALMPYINQMKDADVQRQMQLNQQLGQLTGALNRQQYAFQLAGGAQAQAGQTMRDLATSNPYAASTFRY